MLLFLYFVINCDNFNYDPKLIMTFDISQLDKLEYDGSDEVFEKIEEYQDYISNEFIESEEGISLQKEFSAIGFWSRQLIYYGYIYNGVSLASMELSDIKEILNDIFPKKISLESPNDANEIIPELMAFWKFLQKKYGVDQSNKVLNYLNESKNSYYHIMNDSSKFGMAKSFLMQGSSLGFDMSNPDEANQFINIYNQNLLASTAEKEANHDANFVGVRATSTLSKKSQLKKKKLRKMKKASRKRNKKRK